MWNVANLVECLPNLYKAPICNPSIWEVGAGRSDIQNYPWRHNGFEAILTDIHDILSPTTERDGLFCSGFLEFYMDFRTSRSIHEEKRTPGFSAMTLNLSV